MRGGSGSPAGRPRYRVSTIYILLGRREVYAPVLLPALLGGLGALGPLLAIAGGLQLVAGNTQLHQKVLGGTGAPVAQTKVILSRAALVAVSLDGDGGAREIRQNRL